MSAKVSCPVLRGGESGDARTLPDNHGIQSVNNLTMLATKHVAIQGMNCPIDMGASPIIQTQD